MKPQSNNINNVNKFKPTPPSNVILYESDLGSKKVCFTCKSSLKRKFGFIKTKYCINSQCLNYYKLYE